MIWAGQLGNKFEAPGWWQATNCNKLRVDPTLQVRLQQGGMQTNTQSNHTGEEQWCNVDQYLDETVSSGACAVVGFFVGYTVALPKHKPDRFRLHRSQAELSVDWSILPPCVHCGSEE